MLIIKNILHHKDKYIFILLISFLVSFSVLSAICLTDSLKNGIEKARNSLGADLVIVPKGEGDGIDESILYGGSPLTLKMDRNIYDNLEIDAIKDKFPRLYLATLEGASCCDASIQVIGTDLEDDFILKSLTDISHLEPNEIIVGSRLGLKVGDTPQYFGRRFKVVDVLPKTRTATDLSAYICFQTAYEIENDYSQLGLSDTDISAIFIRTDKADIVYNMIKSQFGRLIDVVAIDKKSAEYTKTVSLIEKADVVIILITLIIAIAAISGLSYIHTIHRRNETGALYLIGMKKGQIMLTYFNEMALVMLTGCIMGIILQITIFTVFNNLLSHLINIPIEINLMKMLVPYSLVLFSTYVSAFLFTVISSKKILRTSPSELIKEGN